MNKLHFKCSAYNNRSLEIDACIDSYRLKDQKRAGRAHRLFVCNFLPRLFYIICHRALTGVWSLYSTLSYDMGSLYTWKLERGRPVPDTWESAADRNELYTYASSLSSEISVLCWRPVLQESERARAYNTYLQSRR